MMFQGRGERKANISEVHLNVACAVALKD